VRTAGANVQIFRAIDVRAGTQKTASTIFNKNTRLPCAEGVATTS